MAANIAKLPGLLRRSRVHQPSLGLGRDCRLLARSRPVVECRQRTIGDRPLDAALDGLMMHSESAAPSEERQVFPIRQKNPRPLYPACRLRSRPRDRREPRAASDGTSVMTNTKPAIVKAKTDRHPVFIGSLRLCWS